MSLFDPEREMVAEAKESPLFEVVRPFCADTKEKRDWPEIADLQAAKIVLAVLDSRVIQAIVELRLRPGMRGEE